MHQEEENKMFCIKVKLTETSTVEEKKNYFSLESKNTVEFTPAVGDQN